VPVRRVDGAEHRTCPDIRDTIPRSVHSSSIHLPARHTNTGQRPLGDVICCAYTLTLRFLHAEQPNEGLGISLVKQNALEVQNVTRSGTIVTGRG
jgi:hypothetical protein